MANLSVTLRCNQSCDYCFASGIADLSAPQFMSEETFHRALEFLKRSGVEEARFLGGEPSLHPRLVEMVNEALRRGFQVRLFSNGLLADKVVKQLQGLPSGGFSVLVNATPPGGGEGPSRLKRRQRTLRALGSRVTLGLNISQAGTEMGFLLDWIDRYSLHRSVRLGLAHPSLHTGNRYLHPKFYAAVGLRLDDFAGKAKRGGISLDLDCGFVPCMFPDSFHAAFPDTVKQSGRRCNPILDVLPNGDIVACYPLAELGHIPLDQMDDADAARSCFRRSLVGLDGFGIYPHCGNCPSFRDRSCLGGCRAAALLRLRNGVSTDRLEGPQKADSPRPTPRVSVARSGNTATVPPVLRPAWVLPYIDQPLEFWQQLRDDFQEQIAEVYFPLPGGLVGSGRPPQPDKHLEEFLRHGRLPAGVLINPVVLPQPVDSLAGPIIDCLRRLRDEYGVRCATVTDLLLAMKVRDALPDFSLTASVLMDVCRPNQATLLNGVFDRLAPSSRVMRDLPALHALRGAFRGGIRLIVNEGCLPGCLLRPQHFYEMSLPTCAAPESLCGPILERQPWLRLTGAWVLPQHLYLYDGLCDELKLAGRVTLRDPVRYRRVVTSYVFGLPLTPNEIGGGPASVLEAIDIRERFFETILSCEKQCHVCRVCEEEWQALHRLPSSAGLRNRAEVHS